MLIKKNFLLTLSFCLSILFLSYFLYSKQDPLPYLSDPTKIESFLMTSIEQVESKKIKALDDFTKEIKVISSRFSVSVVDFIFVRLILKGVINV